VHAFFISGIAKWRDWETTIYLFTEEFHVPLLSPQLAAVSGTAGEIGLSVLLALGLFGRFAAAGLFMVNVMAVISYPALTEGGLAQHFYWGAMIATLIAFGPGRLSLDAWLQRFPLFRSLALDAR
jgi:putative oxidoreductase